MGKRIEDDMDEFLGKKVVEFEGLSVALSTVLTKDGRNFFIKIPFNFETGQVGKIESVAKPDRMETIETFKLNAVQLGVI